MHVSGAKRVRAPRRAHIHCKSMLQLCMFQAPKEYVHRVGRTARLGQLGQALLFLLPSETPFVNVLSRAGISRLYLGCISGVSRLYLGCISGVSRVHLGCISGISRRSHEHISTSPVRLVPRGGRHGSCSTPLRVTAKSTLPRWSVA